MKKLPRNLSYPIGAAAVDEALAGVLHADALTIKFWGHEVVRGSEFRRLLAEGRPYTIITACYQPTGKPGFIGSNAMAAGGWYQEKWEFSIYPVRSEFKELANRLLGDQGLPAVAEWLNSARRTGWTAVWQRVELVFDPVNEVLMVRKASGV